MTKTGATDLLHTHVIAACFKSHAHFIIINIAQASELIFADKTVGGGGGSQTSVR